MLDTNSESWTEWMELGGSSLYSAVPKEFCGDWDWHEVEYRFKDGKIISGQVYPDEAIIDEYDYYKEWYFIDADGFNIDVDSVVAWRYKKD